MSLIVNAAGTRPPAEDLPGQNLKGTMHRNQHDAGLRPQGGHVAFAGFNSTGHPTQNPLIQNNFGRILPRHLTFDKSTKLFTDPIDL